MTRLNIGLLVALLLAALMGNSRADNTFTVQRIEFADQKAVFATVESPNVVPARARIGGTVVSLAVREGDTVTQGQTVAVVGDEKLLLQIKSLDARSAGLEAQLAQAKLDVARAETLFRQGAGPRTTLEQARTAMDVATSALRALAAERAVLTQNLNEGQVLAPVAGRVLTTPLTVGSVVLNGDTVATIGELPFMLRLRIPERHARSLKVGDPIRLDANQLGVDKGAAGTIALIYPKIEEGRVVADARVIDLGQYFVGDRTRVWIDAGMRGGYVVPAEFVRTRAGLDYVLLRQADGKAAEIPVQRGQVQAKGIEILSGTAAGDVLVHP